MRATARDVLYAALTVVGEEPHISHALDAYRDEVLQEAAARIRAYDDDAGGLGSAAAAAELLDPQWPTDSPPAPAAPEPIAPPTEPPTN